jgi:hypothetical protein
MKLVLFLFFKIKTNFLSVGQAMDIMGVMVMKINAGKRQDKKP